MEELDAYNPLIPTGREFKATMMIEYPDPEVRKVELARLKGVEHKVYVQVEGSDKVYAIADEDMERTNDEKTSAVHFLRFPLSDDMAAAMKYGVSLSIGVDHTNYTESVSPVNQQVRDSLANDLA